VVRVWLDGETVHWEVADDGPGFDPSSPAGAGHGFTNMADRMGSLGGDVEVVSSPGHGATIRGHVPLP
jgi:signal transduction histidine kinase